MAEDAPARTDSAIPSHPTDGDGAALTTLLRPWLHYPCIIVLTLAALLFDPFEWSAETANLSHDVTQRFFVGPFLYPDDPAREQATVVLVADSDLRELHATWPMPLSLHAEILDGIRLAKPKAEFVDFIFIDQRTGDNAADLQATIEEFREDGIPLIFAYAEGPGVDQPIRPDLGEAKPAFAGVVLPDEHGVARAYQACSRPQK